MDQDQELRRDDHIRIHEDQHVPARPVRPGISGSGDELHRLVDHRGALLAGNRPGSVAAVVVHDDRFDSHAGPGAQRLRGGPERVERRLEVRLLVEGGNDDGELH